MGFITFNMFAPSRYEQRGNVFHTRFICVRLHLILARPWSTYARRHQLERVVFTPGYVGRSVGLLLLPLRCGGRRMHQRAAAAVTQSSKLFRSLCTVYVHLYVDVVTRRADDSDGLRTLIRRKRWLVARFSCRRVCLADKWIKGRNAVAVAVVVLRVNRSLSCRL